MPSPAQILFHRHFRYHDGTYGEKLIVVLNATDLDTPCLVLKTTSQNEQYSGSIQGCNADKKVFLALKKWQPCFLVDTYIQLPEIFEIPIGDLLQGSFAKYITFLDRSLSPDCFAQLLNCLKQFKKDIAESHWEIIFNEKKHKHK